MKLFFQSKFTDPLTTKGSVDPKLRTAALKSLRLLSARYIIALF
jgi:hypothetical protein